MRHAKEEIALLKPGIAKAPPFLAAAPQEFRLSFFAPSLGKKSIEITRSHLLQFTARAIRCHMSKKASFSSTWACSHRLTDFSTGGGDTIATMTRKARERREAKAKALQETFERLRARFGWAVGLFEDAAPVNAESLWRYRRALERIAEGAENPQKIALTAIRKKGA